ncbi:MAG: sugar-transfer associated ATP-grasp domain-containing protein [Candidatus Thiodiazotropha endolucinida]
MLSESHPLIRRLLRFCLLPYCYIKLVPWHDCDRGYFKVLYDLLFIFFKYKYYPDNYGPCRLWEKDRSLWPYYYGSTYNAYPRIKLRKIVQRYDYQIIFNDKELWDLYCKHQDLIVPKSYGVLAPDENYRQKLKSMFAENNSEKLIIKPVLGHAGQGIVLAERTNDNLRIRLSDGNIGLDEFTLLERSIVQEVVSQHSEIAKIASSSINTIRIITLLTQEEKILVLKAAMRYGQGDSFVDNWSAGGLCIGVDVETGKLFSPAYDKYGNPYDKHTISNVKFDGFQIPRWDEVIALAKKVQEICPFYRLIGCDIAVNETGVVLIEANANPDMVFQEQVCGPILADKRIYDEFKRYDLLINESQRRLYG